MRLLVRLHRVVDHPVTNLIVAMSLILSAVGELAAEMLPPWLEGIEAEHGVLVFGVSQTIKALPELSEGLKELFHGPEHDLDERRKGR
ncbi:MAG: hypothetical protein EP330_15855 [Deltaproteobacteria bacterium]|nr:MAG: hypothetical protein EP330_15855 [Deltaproteobacteria bacterium]